MTNPPTPEDKIDAILTQYRSNMFDYYTSDAWEDGIGYPMTWDDEARHALLAVVNEARLEEVNGFDTRRHYGKDYQDSLDELDEYKDNRLAVLSAATPKENDITQPESTGGE